MSSSGEDLELDEVFGDEAGNGAASSDEAEDLQEQSRPSFPPPKAGVDIAGVSSSTSHQSSTLRASLDEELAHMPAASPPIEMPLRHRTVLASAAPRPQYTRLGTSAPIAIPNMMHRWRSDKGPGGQPDAASTFIPPHQLSKQDDFTFSFTGASPSATLKRERLRARNAILRSTGFLEPQAGQSVPAADVPPELAVSRTPVQSSLTAALTTIGEA